MEELFQNVVLFEYQVDSYYSTQDYKEIAEHIPLTNRKIFSTFSRLNIYRILIANIFFHSKTNQIFANVARANFFHICNKIDGTGYDSYFSAF